MPLASISITGKASLIATSTSQSVALPTTGTPTTCLVTNLGDYVCYILLGTTAPTVTPSNGVPVMPGQSLALTLGSNTFAAAIGSGPVDFALGI